MIGKLLLMIFCLFDNLCNKFSIVIFVIFIIETHYHFLMDAKYVIRKYSYLKGVILHFFNFNEFKRRSRLIL